MIQAGEGHVAELKLDTLHRREAARDWEIDEPVADEVPAYYQRRSAGVWACIATLTVALGVIAGYGYAVLSQEGIQAERVPGIAKSLAAIAQHVGNVETRLANSQAGQQRLAAQVRNFDAQSQAALTGDRLETRQLVASVKAALLRDLNQRNAAFQTQLAQLSAERNADRAHLAVVVDQLAQARNELASAQQGFAAQVAALRDEQGEEHRELASMSSAIPTRQVEFEAQKSQKDQLLSSIFFLVTKTDVRHQRFDGTIALEPDNQKVSVQGQGVRSPVVFFPGGHGKACVLVVTSVTPNGVSGYLLIPAKNGATDAPDFISASDNSRTLSPLPEAHKSSVAEQ